MKRVRLGMFCLLLLGISGCGIRNDKSALISLTDVLSLAALVLAVIALITIVYRLTRQLAWIGVLVGLICGTAVIMSVPVEAQYIFIGSILGVGADYFASTTKTGSPTTMIESLSEFIAKATNAANKVAEPVEFEDKKAQVSFLVWSTLGTIALMLVLGRTLQAFSIGEVLLGAQSKLGVNPTQIP